MSEHNPENLFCGRSVESYQQGYQRTRLIARGFPDSRSFNSIDCAGGYQQFGSLRNYSREYQRFCACEVRQRNQYTPSPEYSLRAFLSEWENLEQLVLGAQRRHKKLIWEIQLSELLEKQSKKFRLFVCPTIRQNGVLSTRAVCFLYKANLQALFEQYQNFSLKNRGFIKTSSVRLSLRYWRLVGETESELGELVSLSHKPGALSKIKRVWLDIGRSVSTQELIHIVKGWKSINPL